MLGYMTVLYLNDGILYPNVGVLQARRLSASLYFVVWTSAGLTRAGYGK